MATDCGGCQGLGAHRRWCAVVVGHSASIFGRLAEQAEDLGDRVGGNDPEAANQLYAAAGLLRQRADLAARAWHQRDSSGQMRGVTSDRVVIDEAQDFDRHDCQCDHDHGVSETPCPHCHWCP